MAYLYRHIRLDKNEPFYIGIGTGKYFKRAKNKIGRNPIWKRIANKTDYEVEILFDDMELEECKKKEIEFIALYGRIVNGDGTLANISGGGDGMFDVPQYIRDEYSKKFKGAGNPFYGKKHTQETRDKISANQLGKKRHPLSEETKRKIGLVHKGKSPWCKGKKDPKGSLARSGVNHSTYKGRICSYDKDGNYLKTFECIKDAAIFYNLGSTNNIRRVIIGDRNYCGGMKFKYENATTMQK